MCSSDLTVYDFKTEGEVLSEDEKMFRNFQLLFRNMMKISKVTGNTGSEVINKVQNEQTTNFSRVLTGFLEYNILFRYGNPSNFDRRVFSTFSTRTDTLPYTYLGYYSQTPNSLPSNGGSVTLQQSKNSNPAAWKALEEYVGF